MLGHATATLLVLSLTYLLWACIEYRASTGPPSLQLQHAIAPAGQLRTYDWTVERRKWSADGVLRDMITVNGEFPGPTIEANVGDSIQVTVRNCLPTNISSPERNRYSTSMGEVYPPNTESMVSLHWHGLSMRGTPQADGAVGFTSPAISPGMTHTYTFQLSEEDSGTHWWHSHVGMSRSDGLWGALIVHSDKERSHLRDLAGVQWQGEDIITVNDHYHKPGAEQLSWFLSRHSLGFEPAPESSLINGRNQYDCQRVLMPGVDCHDASSPWGGSRARIQLDPATRYRLRLINTGSLAEQTISIDGHTMTIIEADGQLVRPVSVHRISIAPGQRYSVILERPRNHRDRRTSFWLRSEMDPACFNFPNSALNLTALAVIDYSTESGAGESSVPSSTAWPGDEHSKMPSLVSLLSDPAPSLHFDKGDKRVILSASLPKMEKHNLSPMGYLNHSTWRAPAKSLLQAYSQASLAEVQDPVASKLYDPAHQLVITSHSSKDRVMELVINNRDESAHPFHLHGHKFWIMEISESTFGWGGYTDQGQSLFYHLEKAPRRDTVNVPRRGYAVIRWVADNPGVWAFHCHVLLHMVSGMAMAFVEKPESIMNTTQSPGRSTASRLLTAPSVLSPA